METIQLDPLQKLARDIKQASLTLSLEEIGFLVKQYYTMQENRIAAAAQVRELVKEDKPHEILDWLAKSHETLENQVKGVLDRWTDKDPLSSRVKQVCGIGPVISAGLAALFDVTDRPTAGHFWRFAGLDPTQKWEKGKKRPWCADAKRLLWIASSCFVKVSGLESDVYGKIYLKRKAEEEVKNALGEYTLQAATKLEKFKIGKDTKAYEFYSKGQLPPGHLHARAMRYTAKLFLSHYHHVAYEIKYGTPPPKPFAIAILGHGHYIPPPF